MGVEELLNDLAKFSWALCNARSDRFRIIFIRMHCYIELREFSLPNINERLFPSYCFKSIITLLPLLVINKKI